MSDQEEKQIDKLRHSSIEYLMNDLESYRKKCLKKGETGKMKFFAAKARVEAEIIKRQKRMLSSAYNILIEKNESEIVNDWLNNVEEILY